MNEATIPMRVLVTGSGTWPRRETALEFARQGADVVLHYSRNEEGARSAIQEIRAMGRRADAFKADFDDVTQAQSLGHEAIKFLGGVDCLSEQCRHYVQPILFQSDPGSIQRGLQREHSGAVLPHSNLRKTC